MGRKRQKYETDEERYYLRMNTGSNDGKEIRRHVMNWRRRTVIFHYSNGTNKCSIEGCNAPVEALTLDHTEFNGIELSNQYGRKSARGGSALIDMLIDRNFPEVPISVKCMAHNAANKNPMHGVAVTLATRTNRDHIDSNYRKVCSYCKIEQTSIHFGLNKGQKDGLNNYCSVCSSKARNRKQAKDKALAFSIYGYTGDSDYMTFEHSNNDGNVHRAYLSKKYGWTDNLGGGFIQLLLREYKAGEPNWPGLIVVHANDNHIGRKQFLDTLRKESNEEKNMD